MNSPDGRREMIHLYRSIVNALPADRGVAGGRIIGLMASQPREGVSTMARMLAETAADVGGARVLICHVTAPNEMALPSLTDCNGDDDQSTAYRWLPPSGAMKKVQSNRSGIALASLVKAEREGEVAIHVDRIDTIIEALRQEFDLIVIDAGPVNRGPIGLALACKVDRMLLVIEAGRTPLPAIKAAKEAIEMNGGKLLGAVLNKRRFRRTDGWRF